MSMAFASRWRQISVSMLSMSERVVS